MENIKLNKSMINKFFGGMDLDCIEQVKGLVEQGAVLNPKDGKGMKMNTLLLDNILDRQMSNDQIEVLEELLRAIRKIDNTDIEEAFKAEAPNHKVFDVCYKEDTSHLIERVEEAFPNLEGYIEQLTCTDYWTDHDVYNSIIDERDAKDKLIAKINAWKDSVDVFLDNLDECY